MTYETIIYEPRDAVALITLNRPDKLNAWTHQMRDELLDALARANADPAIGAIVVTGAGRGFCAGADIGAMFKRQLDDTDAPDGTSADEEAGEQDGDSGVWVRTVRASKPMIAAVNGPSIGVGLTMILPFDVILASEEAKFCCAFVKMGVVTELASSHFLVQRMGFGAASEAALTARMIGGEEAVALRLADRLVPHGELVDEALSLAGRIARNPDRQLRMVKQLLGQNGTEADLDVVMTREFALLDECYRSPEHREAVDAFLEKRAPEFVRQAGG